MVHWWLTPYSCLSAGVVRAWCKNTFPGPASGARLPKPTANVCPGGGGGGTCMLGVHALWCFLIDPLMVRA